MGRPVRFTLTHTGVHSALWTFRLAQFDCFLTAPGQEPACIAAAVVRVDFVRALAPEVVAFLAALAAAFLVGRE